MPNKQRHRGRHPGDDACFAPWCIPALCAAVNDLSWLHTRGYSEKAALKIVGDRYQLTVRQRMAVQRAACGDDALDRRRRHFVPPERLAAQAVIIDGYNLIITVENALSGGILFHCRDGCLRDIASLHGSYHRVEETLPAIGRIGDAMAALRIANAHWLFDAPVSNSRRLCAMLLEEAAQHGWPWTAECHPNTDAALIAADAIVVSADSAVIDNAPRWTNLTPVILNGIQPPPQCIRLCPASC